jgi:ABC-type Zn uptake system ZnuABC Zn-binding protein ZnuA/ABC-type Mn2+/Zn2+ transport system permease subunit
VGTAAFPGLVLAGGLGFAAALGAFGTAALFAASVGALAARRREGHDSFTALVLVGCLAGGVLLASDVFHSGADVESLLFGSLLTVDGGDIALAAGAAVLTLGAALLLSTRWLAVGFDPQAARSLGVRSPAPDAVLLGLVALATTAALSAIGALLVSAVFVVPAATTRLWLDRMRPWQLATAALVAVEGVAGLWLSFETNAPPGATIATIAAGAFAVTAVARLVPRKRAVLAVAATGALALAGCGTGTSSDGRLRVVATTTQLGDLARNVGGSAVDVHQILQPNTDPHEYEPRPRDVLETSRGKVVLESGDNLDHWMKQVVDQSGGHPRVVDVGAAVPVKRPGEATGSEASTYDPHWWHDPVNAEAAVRTIRDALSAADPTHREAFAANASAYLERLARLQTGIRRCFAAVPAGQRKLVTDHDAFGYFAARFGIDVVGAVIPSQTTQAQSSAGDVAKLARVIRREHVKAVFPESSINPRLAKAIARETGARADYTLYGDTLGPKGSAGATYLGMELANADAMTRGFTAGARSCAVAGLRT